MLVSVTSEGGIASDGEIPRTWVIEEPSDDEKGRKGEPDKRSPVMLGADTLRLARHRGRPLPAVRRRLDLPRHRSVGEVLHHANAQPRAARRLLRHPAPRVSSNGAGETGDADSKCYTYDFFNSLGQRAGNDQGRRSPCH